ncbi:MAG: DUF6816 family protein [Microcystaceae cyanobacterium]
MHILKLLIILGCLCFSWGLSASATLATSLSERWGDYPHWNHQPSLSHTTGDIHYPEQFSGTWQVTSTLVEQIAPLAPTLKTPGFEDNRRYLQEPLGFKVRFQPESSEYSYSWAIPSLVNSSLTIVADRRYNATEISRAYLGESAVLGIEVDLKPSPRLTTYFPDQRTLISTVLGYAVETPDTNHFFTDELTRQQFREERGRYRNEVETLTAYYLLDSNHIEAEQITAIYLTSDDPSYQEVKDQPIALYRYQLSLEKLSL